MAWRTGGDSWYAVYVAGLVYIRSGPRRPLRSDNILASTSETDSGLMHDRQKRNGREGTDNQVHVGEFCVRKIADSQSSLALIIPEFEIDRNLWRRHVLH